MLVADDDPVIRTLVGEYLSSMGYDVTMSANGEECLKCLTEALPDVLLLDLLMPDMNGVEVLKNIRANAAMAKVPVIMLSANSDTQLVANKSDVAANAYLEKPFEMRSIIETITKVCE